MLMSGLLAGSASQLRTSVVLLGPDLQGKISVVYAICNMSVRKNRIRMAQCVLKPELLY